MTVKELKTSLSRLPGDLDDSEVFVNFMDEDGRQGYDYLAFTAYSELPFNEGTIVYMLGTEKAAISRLKSGTLRHPDGTIATEEDGINND